jgi:hypothetical protein
MNIEYKRDRVKIADYTKGTVFYFDGTVWVKVGPETRYLNLATDDILDPKHNHLIESGSVRILSTVLYVDL